MGHTLNPTSILFHFLNAAVMLMSKASYSFMFYRMTILFHSCFYSHNKMVYEWCTSDDDNYDAGPADNTWNFIIFSSWWLCVNQWLKIGYLVVAFFFKKKFQFNFYINNSSKRGFRFCAGRSRWPIVLLVH